MNNLSPKHLLSVTILGFVLVSCGTPRAATAPTQPPTATAEPTAILATHTPAPRQPTAVPRGYVSKVIMGEKWPLSIDEGTIVCDRTAILLRAPDGHLYAVNGTARAQVGHFGWLDIRDITLPDPNIAGLIMNVQPLVDVGLALCG